MEGKGPLPRVEPERPTQVAFGLVHLWGSAVIGVLMVTCSGRWTVSRSAVVAVGLGCEFIILRFIPSGRPLRWYDLALVAVFALAVGGWSQL